MPPPSLQLRRSSTDRWHKFHHHSHHRQMLHPLLAPHPCKDLKCKSLVSIRSEFFIEDTPPQALPLHLAAGFRRGAQASQP